MSKQTMGTSKLAQEIKDELTTWMNFSKADSTWSNYRTVDRLLERCQEEKMTTFDWPMSKDDVLLFIHWLIKDRRLKASTVSNYLAGVRNAHIARGLDPPEIRTVFVNQILKGRENWETIDKTQTSTGTEKGRAPMTVALMKKLKLAICRSNLGKSDKFLIWAVSTLAFFGAFRIHELLCKHESTFDPDRCLLKRDVSVGGGEEGRGGTVSVRLKCPKERKAGRPTVVDILEIGGPLCPWKAFNRWSARTEQREDMPMFCWQDGTPLTGRRFNEEIKRLLGDSASTSKGTISSHSFRSAVPTILGELGHSENEIKAVGRWSSRAFTAYMKGSRTQRLTMARKIASLF